MSLVITASDLEKGLEGNHSYMVSSDSQEKKKQITDGIIYITYSDNAPVWSYKVCKSLFHSLVR